MTRQYTLKRRAERVADTRRRLVESAIELHGTVGPAATTLSMIAERAGVQRHTLYAHFPDEKSLFLACSGLSLERDPLPEPSGWTSIPDVQDRLRHGLAALYAWYARNEQLVACVLRDAEHHAMTREISEYRFGPVFGACRKVLGRGLTARQRALLAVALDFHAWRALTRESQASPDTAAAMFAQAIRSAAAPEVGTAGRGQRVAPTRGRRARA
jgi:AcrR family transcriptional regulator